MTLTKKFYLSLATFSILSIGLIFFLIYPLFIEIKRNSKNLISQKQTIQALTAKIENLEKFKILYQDLKPDLEKIETLFVDPEIPIEFISFLERTSEDCDVLAKISSAPARKIKTDPWPSINFQISTFSSSPNFLKFLEKLESSPYLIEISNLSIQRMAEADLKLKEYERFTLGDVKATLTIKVYTK